MNNKALLSRAKIAFRHVSPTHIMQNRMTAGRISRFAEKVGLVYFGYVNHRSDEHRLIRGHTVSQTHRDDHYAVGTVKGYDVALVSRNDASPRHPSGRYQSLIMTLDLRTKDEIPHMYIGHITRETTFKSTYHQLHLVTLDEAATYPASFTQNYVVYTSPSKVHEVAEILGTHVADVIATHFQEASIEIDQGVVYIYIESEHPSEVLLEKMLSNCLWLGEVIDAIHLGRKFDLN
ncbi:hypothetical protein H7Y29_03900 [Microbacteriaceae bacterium]|nr:hypothetical protein [Candidatus Saccharibacteria bacterium]